MPEHSLNVSDHLALTIPLTVNPPCASHPNIDWRKSVESDKIALYECAVKDVVQPFLDITNNTVSQLDDEIRHVCASIKHAAEDLLPISFHIRERGKTSSKIIT